MTSKFAPLSAEIDPVEKRFASYRKTSLGSSKDCVERERQDLFNFDEPGKTQVARMHCAKALLEEPTSLALMQFSADRYVEPILNYTECCSSNSCKQAYKQATKTMKAQPGHLEQRMRDAESARAADGAG